MAGSCNSIYIYFLVNKVSISFNFQESLVFQAFQPISFFPFLVLHVMLKEGDPFNLCTNSSIICHQNSIPILLCSPIKKLTILERVKCIFLMNIFTVSL